MGKKVNKDDIDQFIADELSLSKKQVAEITKMFLSQTIAMTAMVGEVDLAGFGEFKAKDRAARVGRNPRTGEPLQIAAKRVVSFRAWAKFKNEVALP